MFFILLDMIHFELQTLDLSTLKYFAQSFLGKKIDFKLLTFYTFGLDMKDNNSYNNNNILIKYLILIIYIICNFICLFSSIYLVEDVENFFLNF